MLRHWKKYGIRDVVVDKHRSVIFGRVDVDNCECPIIISNFTFFSTFIHFFLDNGVAANTDATTTITTTTAANATVHHDVGG